MYRIARYDTNGSSTNSYIIDDVEFATVNEAVKTALEEGITNFKIVTVVDWEAVKKEQE